MPLSSTPAEVIEVLELFGYTADQDPRAAMLREMREAERIARSAMRKPLRPQAYSEISALADAAIAAQRILRNLSTER